MNRPITHAERKAIKAKWKAYAKTEDDWHARDPFAPGGQHPAATIKLVSEATSWEFLWRNYILARHNFKTFDVASKWRNKLGRARALRYIALRLTKRG